MTIKTLGIACLNRGDHLMRCVLSVDYPIENLFLINNGKDLGVAETVAKILARTIPNEKLFEDIKIESHNNLGCGPSWNRIIRTSPGDWLICGNDIQFGAGGVKKIVEAHALHQDASLICASGYNVFVLTEAGLSNAGLFDENFYPAYFEDCDHFRRIALSGAKAVNVPGFECVHGEAPYWGSSTIKSDPELDRKNGITFGNLQRYYVMKWGGAPGRETFQRPFNRDIPLDHWEMDPEFRRQNSI
jgi:GT2 family glycosyltransferase